MPKIPNWKRNDEVGPNNCRRAWVNEETGELLYVSHKIPKQEHYVIVGEQDELKTLLDGKRIGSSPDKNEALKIASKKMKQNPHGFLSKQKF